MTADIVNLRKARKARDRSAQKKRAEENRVKFGRTKAEREHAEADQAIQLRRLDGHVRDGDDEGSGGSEPSP